MRVLISYGPSHREWFPVSETTDFASLRSKAVKKFKLDRAGKYRLWDAGRRGCFTDGDRLVDIFSHQDIPELQLHLEQPQAVELSAPRPVGLQPEAVHPPPAALPKNLADELQSLKVILADGSMFDELDHLIRESQAYLEESTRLFASAVRRSHELTPATPGDKEVLKKTNKVLRDCLMHRIFSTVQSKESKAVEDCLSKLCAIRRSDQNLWSVLLAARKQVFELYRTPGAPFPEEAEVIAPPPGLPEPAVPATAAVLLSPYASPRAAWTAPPQAYGLQLSAPPQCQEPDEEEDEDPGALLGASSKAGVWQEHDGQSQVSSEYPGSEKPQGGLVVKNTFLDYPETRSKPRRLCKTEPEPCRKRWYAESQVSMTEGVPQPAEAGAAGEETYGEWRQEEEHGGPSSCTTKVKALLAALTEKMSRRPLKVAEITEHMQELGREMAAARRRGPKARGWQELRLELQDQVEAKLVEAVKLFVSGPYESGGHLEALKALVKVAHIDFVKVPLVQNEPVEKRAQVWADFLSQLEWRRNSGEELYRELNGEFLGLEGPALDELIERTYKLACHPAAFKNVVKALGLLGQVHDPVSSNQTCAAPKLATKCLVKIIKDKHGEPMSLEVVRDCLQMVCQAWDRWNKSSHREIFGVVLSHLWYNWEKELPKDHAMQDMLKEAVPDLWRIVQGLPQEGPYWEDAYCSVLTVYVSLCPFNEVLEVLMSKVIDPIIREDKPLRFELVSEISSKLQFAYDCIRYGEGRLSDWQAKFEPPSESQIEKAKIALKEVRRTCKSVSTDKEAHKAEKRVLDQLLEWADSAPKDKDGWYSEERYFCIFLVFGLEHHVIKVLYKKQKKPALLVAALYALQVIHELDPLPEERILDLAHQVLDIFDDDAATMGRVDENLFKALTTCLAMVLRSLYKEKESSDDSSEQIDQVLKIGLDRLAGCLSKGFGSLQPSLQKKVIDQLAGLPPGLQERWKEDIRYACNRLKDNLQEHCSLAKQNEKYIAQLGESGLSARLTSPL